MDVSAPITAAIPGVAGLVVAALLPTTEPLKGAEVASACSTASEMGVRKALARLAGSGVVLRVPGGYVLNRNHLVYPALELLDGLHGALRSRIDAALVEWGREVAVAGIFGSTARRDGNSESDIDVLLISDDPALDSFALDLSERVRQWTGNDCHVMALSIKEVRRMKRAGEPIVNEWLRELEPIVGSITELLAPRRRVRS